MIEEQDSARCSRFLELHNLVLLSLSLALHLSVTIFTHFPNSKDKLSIPPWRLIAATSQQIPHTTAAIAGVKAAQEASRLPEPWELYSAGPSALPKRHATIRRQAWLCDSLQYILNSRIVRRDCRIILDSVC